MFFLMRMAAHAAQSRVDTADTRSSTQKAKVAHQGLVLIHSPRIIPLSLLKRNRNTPLNSAIKYKADTKWHISNIVRLDGNME